MDVSHYYAAPLSNRTHITLSPYLPVSVDCVIISVRTKVLEGNGMSDERLVSGNKGEEEAQIEKSLRPKRLGEFIGQEKVVEQLKIAIAAAKGRHEPLDHTLFYGPPGLGKTSLSNVLA